MCMEHDVVGSPGTPKTLRFEIPNQSETDLPMVDFPSFSLREAFAQAGKLCTTKEVAAFAAGLRWILHVRFKVLLHCFPKRGSQSLWQWFGEQLFLLPNWRMLGITPVCSPLRERARRGEWCSRSWAALATCGGLGEELRRRREKVEELEFPSQLKLRYMISNWRQSMVV